MLFDGGRNPCNDVIFVDKSQAFTESVPLIFVNSFLKECAPSSTDYISFLAIHLKFFD
jgi:hypothetical protein